MKTATIRRVCVVSIILFLMPQLCIGQSQSSAPAQQINQKNSAATTSISTPAIPAYPDSPKGLEKQMRDMLKLEKGRDDDKLSPYMQSLALPSPDTWFRATFGDAAGARSEEHSLNSSHPSISYAVFCLKKKTKQSFTLFFI